MKPYRPDLEPPTHPGERLPQEWAAVFAEWGEPAYRALQVFRWIHARGIWDPEQMTDLSKSLRARLKEDGLAPLAELTNEQTSSDKTQKWLVHFNDGKKVETVLMFQGAQEEEPDEDPVYTARSQCVSTQVGCAMGCVFCASGMMGLDRQLTAAEIVAQVVLVRGRLKERERLRNLVFMGMGEPLHNYPALARALTLLTHPEGLDFSMRRITVSTSGLIDQINKISRDFNGDVPLAISLHAATEEKRSQLMPINRRYTLADLMKCLRRYPLRRGRRITMEYTLIQGLNDSLQDAEQLAKLLQGIPSKINLIPMNPVPDNPLGPPSEEVVEAFQERLLEHNFSVFVRKRRGDDIQAACGQLVLQEGRARRVRNVLPIVQK